MTKNESMLASAFERVDQASQATRMDHPDTQVGIVMRAADSLNNRIEELAYRANHDSLTGLLNKRAFGEKLDHVLANEELTDRNFGMLYIDMTNFKMVNDSLGHDSGDKVLRDFTGILADTLRSDDSLAYMGIGRHSAYLGRLGGDEFAVLVDVTPRAPFDNIDEAEKSIIDSLSPAERMEIIIDRIMNNFISNTELVDTGVWASIGYSVLEKDDSADKVLSRAETSMMIAKDQYKAQVGLTYDRESKQMVEYLGD